LIEDVCRAIQPSAVSQYALVTSAPCKAEDHDVLVKLNASWDLNPSAMRYTTYSEGYRHGGAQAVPSLENGDPFGEPNAEAIRTFESDSVKNYEVGIKGGTDAFQYTAAAFYVDWEDPQLNTTSAFFGFFLAANGQEASTRGIELELEGYLTDTLHYRVGYTWLEAEDRTTGEPLTRRPQHQGRLALDAPLGLPGLAASVRVRSQSSETVDAESGHESPGFTTVDLKLNQTLGDSLRLFLGVDNITGEQRDFSDANDFSPVAGRLVYAGFRRNFDEEQ